MNRLLTEKELYRSFDTSKPQMEMAMGVAEAQDTKTLKAVGEWLDKNTHRFGSATSRLDCFNDPNWTKVISDLLQGEFPE